MPDVVAAQKPDVASASQRGPGHEQEVGIADVGGGQQLIINGQSLREGEDFTFDGSAERGDGKFLVYGGHGGDTLKGGAR